MSDHAKVVASNQYALPVLTYLMWTQTSLIASIQQLDQEGRKIIVENEYKNTKIKAAVKLYCNADPTMAAVRSFEELAVQNGRHSIIKDAKKYAEELDLQLWLNFPNPVAVADGKEVEAKKVKQAICKARQQGTQSTVSEERWQGKLIKKRWDDEKVRLDECFAWLSSWKNAVNAYHRWSSRALPTRPVLEGV